ncbi:hypothetical protein [Streptomyces sp. NPDC017086]|uniref:hypothetical protein n=1 Tax=Streptomyces sp. NPDC017086 TaxID=3364976 RepID=UPI0037B4072A
MTMPQRPTRRQMIAAQANTGRAGARRRTRLEAALREVLDRFTQTDDQYTATASSSDLARWRDALGDQETRDA